MRINILLGIAALALSFGTTATTAQAREYPWCARYDAWAYNCGFTSFQQCLADISGMGGICQQNPRADYAAEPRRRVIKRKQSQR